jgi:hypothetical protein
MVYVNECHDLRALGEITSGPGARPLFSNPIVSDATTARLIGDFHRSAERDEGTLAIETQLYCVSWLIWSLDTRPNGAKTGSSGSSNSRAEHCLLATRTTFPIAASIRFAAMG